MGEQSHASHALLVDDPHPQHYPPTPLVPPAAVHAGLLVDPALVAQIVDATLVATNLNRKLCAIVEHAKKYGDYDFHGTIDLVEADK